MKKVKVPGVLFVAEIPSDCEKATLEDIFKDYGPVSSIEITSDETVSFARITYEAVEDAFSAVADLEDLEINGEPVR